MRKPTRKRSYAHRLRPRNHRDQACQPDDQPARHLHPFELAEEEGCALSILTEALLLRAATMEDELELLGVPGHLAQRVSHLHELEGIIGTASLSTRMNGDVMDITRALVRVGDAAGIHWLQEAAARLEPSDPWERQLLSGISRDMQRVRLDLIARLGPQDLDAQVDRWLDQQDARVRQFRHQLSRAQNAAIPSVAMLAELASQVRVLLSR
jgi:glutamate dehydrogenase